MSGWSNNNKAHVFTWIDLIALRELDRKVDFEAAGGEAMSDLEFFRPADSPPMRRSRAKSLASQMDNLFTLLNKGVYETGFNSNKAINAITDVLVTKSKTIEELGEVVDDCYAF
jgi:hypothetical protein